MKKLYPIDPTKISLEHISQMASGLLSTRNYKEAKELFKMVLNYPNINEEIKQKTVGFIREIEKTESSQVQCSNNGQI